MKNKRTKNELDELRNLLDSQKDVDYEIEVNETDSNVTVVAIHGGKIEKGTTELAYALASHNNYNYYSFQGLKAQIILHYMFLQINSLKHTHWKWFLNLKGHYQSTGVAVQKNSHI